MHGLTLSAAEITAWIGSFVWPFIRVAAMFSIAPALGSNLVPVRVRVVLAALIALIIAPIVGPVPAVEPLSATGLLVTLNQLLIGFTMGFVLQLVFNAVMLAGEHIAMTMGLGFAQMTDPQNGVQVPVISQFFVTVTTLLFLALNGHLALIQMMVRSFTDLPVAPVSLGRGEIWSLLEGAGHMFTGAVLTSLPAVTALLAVNLAMGVMTKAAPQMNLFSVGFPVTMLLGFLAMLVGLPAFLPVFSNLLDGAFTSLNVLMAGAP